MKVRYFEWEDCSRKLLVSISVEKAVSVLKKDWEKGHRTIIHHMPPSSLDMEHYACGVLRVHRAWSNKNLGKNKNWVKTN